MTTLIKYTAPWCAACKTLGATLDRVVADYPDLTVETVDVSQSGNPPDVKTLPTMRLNGVVQAGNMSETRLRAWIDGALRK